MLLPIFHPFCGPYSDLNYLFGLFCSQMEGTRMHEAKISQFSIRNSHLGCSFPPLRCNIIRQQYYGRFIPPSQLCLVVTLFV